MDKLVENYNNLPIEIKTICQPIFIRTQITGLLIEKERLRKSYGLHLRELNSQLKNCEDALKEIKKSVTNEPEGEVK